MSRIIYLVVMLTIFLSISRTFSAVLFELNEKVAAGDYFLSKSTSVHRGLALSYSSTEKNQKCQDIFYAQLYVIPELAQAEPEADVTFWVNDGQTTDGQPLHSLFVEKLEKVGHDQSQPDLREIFFLCVGNFNLRRPLQTSKYFISNAYRSGWWYGNTLNDDNRIHLEQRFFISLSPEHVPLEQRKLEQQYLDIRQTMETLQTESTKYIHFAEKRNALSSLSVFRRLFLCASILSSPIYRVERLEVSFNWMRRNSYPINLEFETLELTFTQIETKTLTFEGFICRGFIDGDGEDVGSTSLYITRAYDDKHSVYVVEKREAQFVLSKYFRNIPLLMNASEPLDEGGFLKNYG